MLSLSVISFISPGFGWLNTICPEQVLIKWLRKKLCLPKNFLRIAPKKPPLSLFFTFMFGDILVIAPTWPRMDSLFLSVTKTAENDGEKDILVSMVTYFQLVVS